MHFRILKSIATSGFDPAGGVCPKAEQGERNEKGSRQVKREGRGGEKKEGKRK